MGKVKISSKRKKSLAKSKVPILIAHDPYDKRLADVHLIKTAVLECLIDGDLESVRDLLIAHLNTVNKLNLSKKAKLGRQTIYDLMDMKKEFNPSLKTFTTILNNLAA